MDVKTEESKPQAELAHPDSTTKVLNDGICSRCSNIDFQKLFTAPKWKPTLELGALGQELAWSSCSVCRLFLSVKTACSCPEQLSSYSVSSDFHAGSLGTILKVNCLRCGSWTAPWSWGDFVIAIADDGHSNGDNNDEPVDQSILPRSNRRARQVTPLSVDYKYLSSCLQRCERRHGATCGLGIDTAAFPWNLKLIDCRKRRVVQAETGCRYAALSYVWGSVETTGQRSAASYSQYPSMLPARLPLTIEDAMTATINLGLDYIWIDRYCIDQYGTEKHMQIKQMDLIYKKAQFTIIAAAGSDSSFGLPGVSSTPRITQPLAKSRGMQLLGIRASSTDVIASSSWITRGWTFQEGHFSNRRLIFTAEYVYFECDRASSSEYLPYLWNEPKQSKFSPYQLGKNDRLRPWHQFSGIQTLLSQYSERLLTFPEDAVGAFEGVINDYRVAGRPITHYRGLLIMPSLVVNDFENYFGRTKPEERTASGRLIAGLCWRSSGSGERRAGFPSWSWAGWKCKISAHHLELGAGLGLESQDLPKIKIERPAGRQLQLEDIVSGSGGKSLAEGEKEEEGKEKEGDEILHIYAWTIPLELRKSKELNYKLRGHYSKKFDESEKVMLVLRGWDRSYLLEAAFLPYLGDSTFEGRPLPHAHGPASYRAVLLNQTVKSYLFLLIVERIGDCYRRVGHIEIGPWRKLAAFSFAEETEETQELREGDGVVEERLCHVLLQHKERQVLRLV